MQKQVTIKKKDRSRAHRKATLAKNKRSRSHGSAKGTSDAVAGGPLGFSLLSKDLRAISGLDLAMNGSSKDKELREVLEMIDTEDKQLQAIEDLYAIVKAQPRYKKLKEPRWNCTTGPIIILQWLLRKLGPLADGENWTIDTWQDGKKLRYRFVTFKPYSSSHMSGGTFKRGLQFLPLDFLPFLKSRDQQLHDLIVDSVALLSKYNKVPIWDEGGGAFQQALDEHLSNEGVITNFILDAQLKIYRIGVAAEYAKLIRQRRKQTSLSEFCNNIAAYDDKSDRQHYMKRWLRHSADMIREKSTINESTYVPHYRSGEFTTPFDAYRFVWSLHPVDIIWTRSDQILEAADAHFGPLRFSITYPGKVVQPMGVSEFPIDISSHLYWGRHLVLGRYREYYYKRMLDDSNTSPSEYYEASRQQMLEQLMSRRNTLIRSIDAHEIKSKRKK